MEHMGTACTAEDWVRVAGLSSCKHSNDSSNPINSPALRL